MRQIRMVSRRLSLGLGFVLVVLATILPGWHRLSHVHHDHHHTHLHDHCDEHGHGEELLVAKRVFTGSYSTGELSGDHCPVCLALAAITYIAAGGSSPTVDAALRFGGYRFVPAPSDILASACPHAAQARAPPIFS